MKKHLIFLISPMLAGCVATSSGNASSSRPDSCGREQVIITFRQGDKELSEIPAELSESLRKKKSASIRFMVFEMPQVRLATAEAHQLGTLFSCNSQILDCGRVTSVLCDLIETTGVKILASTEFVIPEGNGIRIELPNDISNRIYAAFRPIRFIDDKCSIEFLVRQRCERKSSSYKQLWSISGKGELSLGSGCARFESTGNGGIIALVQLAEINFPNGRIKGDIE